MDFDMFSVLVFREIMSYEVYFDLFDSYEHKIKLHCPPFSEMVTSVPNFVSE